LGILRGNLINQREIKIEKASNDENVRDNFLLGDIFEDAEFNGAFSV
jgi:hypothetical protein